MLWKIILVLGLVAFLVACFIKMTRRKKRVIEIKNVRHPEENKIHKIHYGVKKEDEKQRFRK